MPFLLLSLLSFLPFFLFLSSSELDELELEELLLDDESESDLELESESEPLEDELEDSFLAGSAFFALPFFLSSLSFFFAFLSLSFWDSTYTRA